MDYGIEGSKMAAASESNTSSGGANNEANNPPAARSTPRDALVMTAILKEMGISDYEPRVINQMLEFTYRYVTTVLDDAKVYSTHASKKEIDADDVRLAIQSRLDHSYTNPPPRDFLIEIARQKNRTPLPQIQPKSGLRLPPDRYCLTGTNYKLKAQKKPTPRPSPIVSRTPSLSSVPIGSAVKPTQVVMRTPTSSATIATTAPRTTGMVPTTPVLAASVSMTTGLSTKVVKQEPGTPTASSTSAVVLTPIQIASTQVATSSPQPSGLPSSTLVRAGTAQPSSGKTVVASGGRAASMVTISALPSMDETVASAHQPLITPLKRKHDEDDYDI